MASESSGKNAIESVLTDRRVPWLLAVAYLLCSAWLVRSDYALNDEGLFTYMTTQYTRHAFAPLFFFQKSKPVLSLLYWLPVAGGFSFFLLVHSAVAAAGIPLAASLARALDMRLPNLASFILMFSPVYFFGGASGVANTDGVVGVLLFLWLLVARREYFLAGVVLGLLPWIRHEMGLFCAVGVLFGLVVERRPALLAGALAFPLVYWLTGASYHGDWLWLLHHPPTTLEPPGGTAHNAAFPLFYMTASLSNTLPYLAAVSPLVILSFLFRGSQVTRLERWLSLYAAAWLAMATILPSLQWANFGFVPRYMLPILPITALLATRVAGDWTEQRPGWRWVMFAGFVIATLWLGRVRPDSTAAAVVLLLALALLAVYATRRGLAALTATLALVVSAPALGLPSLIPRRELAGYLPRTRQWLLDHHDQLKGPVYTNIILLGPFLRQDATLAGLDLRYFMGTDQTADLLAMGNPRNGQIDAARAVVEQVGVPGARCLWSDRMDPATIPANALFVFRNDDRIKVTLPWETWSPHLQLVSDDGFRVYQFVP